MSLTVLKTLISLPFIVGSDFNQLRSLIWKLSKRLFYPSFDSFQPWNLSRLKYNEVHKYIVFCVFVGIDTCADVSPSLWYSLHKLPIICLILWAKFVIVIKYCSSEIDQNHYEMLHNRWMILFVCHLKVPRKR